MTVWNFTEKISLFAEIVALKRNISCACNKKLVLLHRQIKIIVSNSDLTCVTKEKESQL